MSEMGPKPANLEVSKSLPVYPRGADVGADILSRREVPQADMSSTIFLR
jgi:hypothetical protein